MRHSGRRGATTALFQGVFFAGTAVQIVIRAPHGREHEAMPNTHQRVGRAEQALLASMTAVGLLLPLVSTLTASCRGCAADPRVRAPIHS